MKYIICSFFSLYMLVFPFVVVSLGVQKLLKSFALVARALGRFVYGECLCIYMLVRSQCWMVSLIAPHIIFGDSYSSAPELIDWATLAGRQVLVIPVPACQC